MNNPENLFDSIVSALLRTAKWRRGIAMRYSGDPRNDRSADTLSKMAKEATGLTEEQWLALQPLYDWSWYDVVSESAKRVGFSVHIRTFDEFIEHLVQTLQQRRSVAAA